MELAELETFMAIAESGSLSRAATLLYIAQPTVSHRLQRLEQELGQPLFIRESRGARLTAAGEAFLPHAARAVEAARAGRQAVQHPRPEAQPLLLASAPTVATYRLPGVLAEILQTWPGLEVKVHVARSDEVLEAIRQGEAHAGFVRIAVPDPDLEAVPLPREPVVLVASPRAVAPHPEGWVRGPFVHYDQRSSFWRELDVALFRLGVERRVLVELDSLEGVKAMVKEGIGAAFLPWSTVEADVREKALVVVPVPAELPGRSVTLCHSRRGTRHPALGELIRVTLRRSVPTP